MASILCGEPGDVTVRLYRLFFGRTPDKAGLEYWSDVYRQTRNFDDVSYNMAQNPEYLNRWDGIDNRAYVEGLLYNNLLERPSEEDGINYWVSILDGTARDAQGRSIRRFERHEMANFWVVQPELTALHPVNDPSDCDLINQIQDMPGGRQLTFDYLETNLQASSTRCRVMSVNANWVHRDGAVPFSEHIGFANIDGENVASRNNGNGNANTNSGDNNSRGILGARRVGEGGEQREFSHTFDPSIGSLNILSNLVQKDDAVLQLHANYWDDSPGHQFYDPAKFDNKDQGWDWAVGGITMVVNGQQNADMGNAYTFNTLRHSFAAFKAPSTVMLGTTTTMTAQELIDWLVGQGYTDIMKMDGGGSTELNEGLSATVAGTARPLPVWLGVGC